MTKNSITKKNPCDQTRAVPIHRCWSDLPDDQSRSVAGRLIYPEFLRFRAVCKNWQRAFSDDDDRQRRAVFSFIRVDSSYHFRDTKTLIVCAARFFDLLPPLQVFPIRNIPIRNEIQEHDKTKNLIYPRFCCSHSGWLLLLKSLPGDYYNKPIDTTLFVHEPLQNKTKALDVPPKLDEWYYQSRVVEVAGFSTIPSSEDCDIFLLWKYRRQNGYDSDPDYEEWDEFFITTYHREHRNQEHRSWSVMELPRSNPKKKDWKFIKDLAYVDGIFYCAVDMESEVVLGTFNVALQKWGTMRKRSLGLTSRPEQMNFVKSDEGLLLAVCYQEPGSDDEYCHVYQFDLTREKWTRVNSLGNRVLMLRSCSSVATPAVGEISRLANMIFVSRPYSDSYVAFTWELEGEWRWRQLVR